MPEKRGKGGAGQENYDPKTGQYVEEDSGVKSSPDPWKLVEPISDDVSKSQPKESSTKITASPNSTDLIEPLTLEDKHGMTPEIIERNRKLDDEAKPNPAPVNHEEAYGASRALIQVATKKSKTITPMVQEICESLGGEMVGLEFQLKSEKSLARKISSGMDEGSTLDGAVSDISDALRFTSVIDADHFTEHATRVMQELEKRGFKITKCKNRFIGDDGRPSAGYKDLNLNFTDESGFTFELQFNTPEGMKAKEGLEKVDGKWTSRTDGVKTSHFYYEQRRVLDENNPDNEERIRYLDYMTEKIWQDVPIPKGIENIESIEKE